MLYGTASRGFKAGGARDDASVGAGGPADAATATRRHHRHLRCRAGVGVRGRRQGESARRPPARGGGGLHLRLSGSTGGRVRPDAGPGCRAQYRRGGGHGPGTRATVGAQPVLGRTRRRRLPRCRVPGHSVGRLRGDCDGHRPPDSPERTASGALNVHYPFAGGEWLGTVEFFWQSEFHSNLEQPSAGGDRFEWQRSTCTFGWEDERWRIVAYLENVADEVTLQARHFGSFQLAINATPPADRRGEHQLSHRHVAPHGRPANSQRERSSRARSVTVPPAAQPRRPSAEHPPSVAALPTSEVP